MRARISRVRYIRSAAPAPLCIPGTRVCVQPYNLGALPGAQGSSLAALCLVVHDLVERLAAHYAEQEAAQPAQEGALRAPFEVTCDEDLPVEVRAGQG